MAIREALEIEMIVIKGENLKLRTKIKALCEAEVTRTEELEEAREILTMSSRILQERAVKASEDSQKITHAATSLNLGSNPLFWSTWMEKSSIRGPEAVNTQVRTKPWKNTLNMPEVEVDETDMFHMEALSTNDYNVNSKDCYQNWGRAL
ncbi:hypothetical protein VE03_10093 [Pseudogymnoascus sp. 23342-1-I1]|nr:hypothetical protein VE03_10093 [Pseudogymnoascus sp. 23342-1-I1]